MVSAAYKLKTRAPFHAEWRTSHFDELAGAVVAAWRKHKKEWAVGGIERGPRVLLDRGALALVFDRMDELLSETPKATPQEAAAQALRELAGTRPQ